ncbi:class I SAM-dependent methyltransferase [Halopseudomonas salegens]|uniref:Predicted methyltransferase n=1 Tax=Halopseudomonas salegens TaxID=1434072 RepID=A0A1H2FSQ7_9GAMM|nr:class I SAM-dependent methyltransferase [Halopseudomonas salegens]SDU10371.1 Predicted methyltransferase [Halopseudomonas salegens]
MLRKLVGSLALSLSLSAVAQQDAAMPPQLSLEHQEAVRQAVSAGGRSITNVMRDAHRNPEQTLAFFGVEPGHTVIEAWPGEGWYSEILAPLLREEGKLIAAHFDPQSDNEYFRDSLEDYQRLMQRPRSKLEGVELSVLNYDPQQPIAEPESADRVLTFRNVHNWLAAGEEQAQIVFNKFYAALKPGGKLGVVEHRARVGTSLEQMVETGYVAEELIIAMAEEAGFELLSRSPVNQNPQDNTDHPEGVWTLPPTLRLGDENRAQYLSIGESDRMTLLFIKH